MPRRNKSLKMLNFGGYKRRSSKRGGGFFDILSDSAKKASDATKLALEGNPTHPKYIAHKTIIDALPDKVAKLEERVSDLEVDNKNTVTGEPVEEKKLGGRKRKTRRRRQSKKRSKKSRKSRKSRKH